MGREDLIQVRRGTTTQWTAANPVLASGEPGFDVTTNEFNARFGAAGQLQDDWLIHERQITPAEIARFSERRNIFGPNNATVASETGGEYISIFVM